MADANTMRLRISADESEGVAAVDRMKAKVLDFRDKAAAALGQFDAAMGTTGRETQALRQQIETLTGVVNDNGAATRARAADIAAYGATLDGLRAKYVPLFSAQQAYRQQLAEIKTAVAGGIITEKEADAARQKTKDTFARQVQDLRKVGDAHRKVANDIQAVTDTQKKAAGLSAVDRQIAVSGAVNTIQTLAAGGSLSQTLVTQGFQTAPALPGLLRAIPPQALAATAGIVALTAVVAALGSRLISAGAETRRFAADLKVINPGANATAAQLRQAGFDIADQRGVDRQDANAALRAALGDRRVTDFGVQRQIAGISQDVAAAFGGDAATRAKELTTAVAGGAAGLADYNRALQILEPDEVKHLRDLDEQGHRTQAVAEALALLDSRVGGMAKRLGGEGAASIHALKGAIDDLLESLANSKLGEWLTKWCRAYPPCQ
ncbi:hypothetical protein, partial [Azospirillum sp. B4]|uniref:hypothetical protein n=1 Tax=Azospirillum sp. B4 TaxID=95605 RepID=UPI0005CAA9C7